MFIIFQFSTNVVKCIYSQCFYAARYIFLHEFEQRISYIARTCVKKYTVLENDSYIMTCCRNDKVSALPHENPLSIKEIMINFLTYSVRIYVRHVIPHSVIWD